MMVSFAKVLWKIFDLPEEINNQLQLEQIRLTNVYEGQYGFDKIFTPAAPVLVLKMEGKWVSIDPSSIKTIGFSERPNRTTTTNIAVRKSIIAIHFSKTGKQDFRYMYLLGGLSWKPVYKLQTVAYRCF